MHVMGGTSSPERLSRALCSSTGGREGEGGREREGGREGGTVMWEGEMHVRVCLQLCVCVCVACAALRSALAPCTVLV